MSVSACSFALSNRHIRRSRLSSHQTENVTINVPIDAPIIAYIPLVKRGASVAGYKTIDHQALTTLFHILELGSQNGVSNNKPSEFLLHACQYHTSLHIIISTNLVGPSKRCGLAGIACPRYVPCKKFKARRILPYDQTY